MKSAVVASTMVGMCARIVFMLLLSGPGIFLFGFTNAYAAEPIAKIQGFLLNADSMSRDSETEVIELAGNVQIVSGDRHFQADSARLMLRLSRIELQGRVRMTTPQAELGGDRIVLDYESETGMIYNGYVQSGQVLFEGGMIQKTGPNEYFVQQANYTTCTNCPSSWSFQGTSIRAELGGYAYIRSALLRIGSWPVLPLPYLIVPLKSDRQSGLLTPGFEQSISGGLAVSQSYFWAISRSTDATFTLKNYERRTLKGLANYRYVLDEHSQGEIDVGGIRDRVFKDDERLRGWRPSTQSEPVNRWFVRYMHYHEMPNGWVQRASINNASDLQYPKDFPSETLNHGDSSMENRISFTKNGHDTHFSVDSSYHINLLQGDPLGGNEDAVHRLPEVRFQQLYRPIGGSGFYYSLDLDFVNFNRAGQAFDNLTAGTHNGTPVRFVTNTCNSPVTYGRDPSCQKVDDGVYDPTTDLLRSGQRLDFQPRIQYPINVGGALDIVPTISYRETQYQFPVGDIRHNVRRYLRGELSSRMTFHRVFGDLKNAQGTRYKHEIRPEIKYTALPWVDHRSHPFFGFTPQSEAPTFENQSINDDDIGGNYGLQFDYEDRIYDRNLVTMSVVNTITEKTWTNSVPSYRQLALIKLSQSFDAWKDGRAGPNNQPWSDISSVIDLRLNRVQSYNLLNYFPYQNVTNASSRIRVSDNEGRFVQLGLVKQFKITPGQPVDHGARVEDYSFAGGFVSSHLNLMGKMTYDANFKDTSRRIKSWTYIAQFKPPGDCWLVTLIHNQITGGDTTSSLGLEFNFDGIPKPPLPAEALDAFGF